MSEPRARNDGPLLPAVPLVLLLVVFAPATSSAEHRAALLIGNSGYANEAPLVSPAGDIQIVAAALRKHGFQTTLATDLDSEGLYAAVDRLIKSAPINGTAMVYFSGYVVTSKSAEGPPRMILAGVDGVDGNRPGPSLVELAEWLCLHAATTTNVIVLDAYDPDSRRPRELDAASLPNAKDLPANVWLGLAAGSDTAASTDATRGQPRQPVSAFARKISAARETRLDALLNGACDWTLSTCPQPPFSQAASRAVAPPDALPVAARPGDEWVAPDGTVFCYCPPGPAGAGFWIGKFEVPQSKWPLPNFFRAVGSRRNLPVTRQLFEEIRARLAALTSAERQAGRLPADWQYALPSPAQWEHAARAGSNGQRYFPDAELTQQANFADKSLWDTGEDVYSYADPIRDDGWAELAPVGSFGANAWGLHDVYGNVWEQTDAQVLCGGSWVSPPEYCRATVRKPPLRSPSDYVGLRLVLRPVRPLH